MTRAQPQAKNLIDKIKQNKKAIGIYPMAFWGGYGICYCVFAYKLSSVGFGSLVMVKHFFTDTEVLGGYFQ